jgi:hypothetical protein
LYNKSRLKNGAICVKGGFQARFSSKAGQVVRGLG